MYYYHLIFFFFSDTAPTEIYTLSLHDASSDLAGWSLQPCRRWRSSRDIPPRSCPWPVRRRDRKSTRLNSSHGSISYAVFRLKKQTLRRLVPSGLHDAMEMYGRQEQSDTTHR